MIFVIYELVALSAGESNVNKYTYTIFKTNVPIE